MSKILFEKICGNRTLHNWTAIYDNIDDLLKEMQSCKTYLLGDEMEIRIREIKEHKKE